MHNLEFEKINHDITKIKKIKVLVVEMLNSINYCYEPYLTIIILNGKLQTMDK
jgi:hypothetical protein